MTRPNGIGLFARREDALRRQLRSRDKAIWMAFPIKADGTLGAGKLSHDATADVKANPEKGLPDGLKVDQRREHLRHGRQRRVRVRPGPHAARPDRDQRQDRATAPGATTAPCSTSPPTTSSPASRPPRRARGSDDDQFRGAVERGYWRAIDNRPRASADLGF